MKENYLQKKKGMISIEGQIMKDDINKNTKQKNNKEKNNKKNKIFYKVHWTTIIICSILILFQILIWLYSSVAEFSTLSIFGVKPYIATYQNEDLGFKPGDLVITNKLKDKDKYTELTNLVFKTSKKRKEAIIVQKNDYHIIKLALGNIEGEVTKTYKDLGKTILFLREPQIVILAIIVLICATVIIALVRKKNIGKKYSRIRILKDIAVITFVIVTYASMFFIGRILNYGSLYSVLKENDIPVNTEVAFIVSDDIGTWKQQECLNVFDNEYFKDKKLIAPGVSGEYKFRIQNLQNQNIKYVVAFNEINIDNINLQYKIIKNGEYINDSYNRIENRTIENNRLLKDQVDEYTIEWKWIDADNDTEIGYNSYNVKYYLNIKILTEGE